MSIFARRMGPADAARRGITNTPLQALVLMKNNYVAPELLNDAEIQRATVAGLLSRLSHSVQLLPALVRAQTGICQTWFCCSGVGRAPSGR